MTLRSIAGSCRLQFDFLRRMSCAYWVKNGDDVVSIIVRKPVEQSDSFKVDSVAKEAVCEAESVANAVSRECGARVIKAGSFMSNRGRRFEMVGTVDLEYVPNMVGAMSRMNVLEAI